MNNSLEVIGGRKDGWGDPDTTALNSKHRRDPNLTIQEIVNNVLKKPVFGFEGYEPKPTMGDNTIYANPNTHVRAKAKRIMFCEEASKAKDKVPAADKYQHAIEWNKNPTSRNIKFYTTPRNVIADDIIKKSQNPAKTSPGPAGYNHYDGWKGTLKKIPGTYKQREARITFMQEQTWYANEAPGMKYPSVNLVSIKSQIFIDLLTTEFFLFYSDFTKRPARPEHI